MGREWDPDAGLYYVRNRWYDPETGRFVSEDPIGLAGGINVYAYAANDPVNARDPYGLCVQFVGASAKQHQAVKDGKLSYCQLALPTLLVPISPEYYISAIGTRSYSAGSPGNVVVAWVLSGIQRANEREIEKGCGANVLEFGVDLALAGAGARLLGVLAHRARAIGRNPAVGNLFESARAVESWGGNPVEYERAIERLTSEARDHAYLAGASAGLAGAKGLFTNPSNFFAGVGGGGYELAKWTPVAPVISGLEAIQACFQ